MTSSVLELIRGDSAFLDVVATEDGAPVDLSVVDMWFTAKHRLEDADDAAVIRKTRDAGSIEVTDALQGKATVRIDADDWSGYSGRGPLFWDLQARIPDEDGDLIVTFARGTLKVVQDVTRATS